jgi:heptosyltransferase II
MRPLKAIDPNEVRRLLVRGTNWVGDAVMSVPALREIRRIFSRARISLLVRPWVRDVYSAADFVDEVIEYDKTRFHRGWSGKIRLVAQIKRGEYDLAILLQSAFEAAFHAWLSRIPQRIGYARDGRSLLLTHAVRIDPEVRQVHQGYYYLGILSGAGLLPPKIWQRQYPLSASVGVRDSDSESARDLLRRRGVHQNEVLIGLNPGAFYGGAKRWLSDRYAAVADLLAAKYDARIVIFGAPSERRIADEVSQMMTHKALVMAGETSLGQLMGLLKECRLLITNDSGPMHLAAALDVPQVAIFGSSSEIATGPMSPRAEVLRHPVECSPCFLRECPIDFRCMTGITTEMVFAAACKRMAEVGPTGD